MCQSDIRILNASEQFPSEKYHGHNPVSTAYCVASRFLSTWSTISRLCHAYHPVTLSPVSLILLSKHFYLYSFFISQKNKCSEVSHNFTNSTILRTMAALTEWRCWLAGSSTWWPGYSQQAPRDAGKLKLRAQWATQAQRWGLCRSWAWGSWWLPQ